MEMQKLLGRHVKNYINDTDSYMESRLSDIEQDELQMACKHLPEAGGKRLRPILFLTVCEMFGKNYRDVLPIAAGIESLHVSTLIQDDLPLMDDDQMRRGVKTVHTRFDEPTASLASSILQSKAYGWCSKANVSDEVKAQVVEEMDKTMTKIGIGQDMDIRFEQDRSVTKKEYLEMARNKTAYLYRTSARMGGIVNGLKDSDVENLGMYGENLGIAFQIIDDLLDFKESGTGKDHYSDIKNGKCTYVTIDAMENGVPVFDDSYTIQERVSMIESCGSLERTVETAQEYIDSANQHLGQIKEFDSFYMDTLLKISQVAVNRTK